VVVVVVVVVVVPEISAGSASSGVALVFKGKVQA
jgi:hypothetical protein